MDRFFWNWDIRHVFQGGIVSVFVGWLEVSLGSSAEGGGGVFDFYKTLLSSFTVLT